MTEPEQIEGYQLSPQQRAVHLREDAQGRATHRISTPSVLTPGELADRMEALVAEHEVLRTRYSALPGLRLPVQVVDPAGPVMVEEDTDGRTLLRAGELTVEHTRSQDGTVLLIGLPRLSVDRESWSILTGFLLGESAEPGPVEEEPLQYADVAAWLCEELENAGSAAATATDEETRTATGLPFLLPAGRRDPEAGPVTVVTTLDGPVPARLRAVTRELGVGEEAVLLAAWRALLARYRGNADDRVLVVTQGRSAEGLAGALGLLERPVAVRLSSEPQTPFAQAVRDAEEALRAAGERENHADPEALSTTDAVSFRYLEDRWGALAEPGPAGAYERPGVIHLDCVLGPETLLLTFAGHGGQVAKPDLAALAEAFGNQLADALAGPARAVGVLRLLTPAEPADEPDERHESVLHRFLEHAERNPDRPAVRSGDQVLTYGELARRASATAGLLRRQGVRAGDYVGVVVPAVADTLVALLGTWLAGAAFVPVDPAWPQERIETVLGLAETAYALVPQAAASLGLPVTPLPLPAADPQPEQEAELALAGAGDAAYAVFTSGTSGTPKGVVIGHGQLAHYAAAVLKQLGLGEGAEFAAVSTLAADLSYTAVFPTLADGGCVHLVDADVATSPQALADRFAAHPVSAMKLVPSHLSALLAEARDPAALLPSRVLVLGGEILPPTLLTRLRELAPQLRVFNHYGPTETTVGASVLPLDGGTDERCASVPVGTGMGDNLLTVVDGEGNPLPPWCPGEVVISGPGVGLGYLAQLREGRTGFGERGTTRQYRSGDLGRLVPGAGVEILGRLDDQVKLRGYRVQLGEIEGLLQQQAGVAAGAVVARTDDSGLVSHLDAYVVLTGDADAPSVKDLQTALGRRLPTALIPTGWQVLDRLPLTRNGKLDRKALAPVETVRAEAARPRDSVEQRLLVLWAEVLGLDAIGPDDDFFELGGHSLRAIKLMSRTNSAFGCKLPMSSIFKARTVAAMARLMRDSETRDSNLVPLRPAEGGSSVFCIHPGGGSTLSYWELARLLPTDRPVVGVESLGLHGQEPQRSFAEMAEGYAAEIAAATDGPAVIIGWCFGGIMALETAQALRRTGREVARLIIVDSFAPGFEDEEDDGSQDDLLSESVLIGRFAWHYELDLPEPIPSGKAAFDLLLAEMQKHGHLPPTAGEDDLRKLLDVYTCNMTAIRQHAETTDPAGSTPDYPVLLVRAEPAGVPLESDRTWGWRKLVGPGLAFAAVEADHHSIMRPPAVAELAELVSRVLDAPA
ncbi:amino acid adenylation domain-containing protein [Kitasatospora sp. NPDC101447]|uniref:amino acid adenylation domain-containing protein n=1 Tax=Kitasatospora sp. NPDC101447 TaxID=3364102 RepID=UPI003827ABB2